MKLASWNVNSLKVRLPQLLDFLSSRAPDVMCLQETKLEDRNFPAAEIAAAGYRALFAGQKTYNGVAILSKEPGKDVVAELPGFADEQKRLLAATVAGVRIICIYVPNGQSVGSDKYRYKLEWLAAFVKWLKQELARHPKLALLGDFNIAPQPRDVYDPELLQGQILFSDREREAFRELLGLGLADSFRLFPQPAKSFTWWDYRMRAFRRNMGLRLDHILLSGELARECKSCVIDKEMRKLARPSDHAPVLAETA